MRIFETSAKVLANGEVSIVDLPFAPGTEVEITIRPKRQSAEQFALRWQEVTQNFRTAVSRVSDDEIRKEIDDHRRKHT